MWDMKGIRVQRVRSLYTSHFTISHDIHASFEKCHLRIDRLLQVSLAMTE
jgi:hypothetical protein